MTTSTPLLPRLIAEITTEGPITVARYMELCLHDPVAGYYATRPALGADGDFVTAPLVSQIFGELLGLWCAQAWVAMGSPVRVRWIELGPGDATLMRDMRRAVSRAAPGFLAAAETVLVETSAPLRARQAHALAEAAPEWAAGFAESAGDAPVLVVANEFLDCLPVRQFVRTPAGWAERRVGLSREGGLAFGLAPAPRDFDAGDAPEAPEGVLVEVASAQARLGAEIGGHVARCGGAALLIDYGRASPSPGDTLQALHRHVRVDPLACPGAADLTVHVDFPSVAAAARAAGAATSPIVGQGEFLARLGLHARADALTRARPDRAATIARQVERLAAADQMGELFKVLAIRAPGLDLPGLDA